MGCLSRCPKQGYISRQQLKAYWNVLKICSIFPKNIKLSTWRLQLSSQYRFWFRLSQDQTRWLSEDTLESHWNQNSSGRDCLHPTTGFAKKLRRKDYMDLRQSMQEDFENGIPDYSDAINESIDRRKELQNEMRNIYKDGWNPFTGLDNFDDLATWFLKISVCIVIYLFLMLVIYVFIRLCLRAITRCTKRRSTSPNGPLILRESVSIKQDAIISVPMHRELPTVSWTWCT